MHNTQREIRVRVARCAKMASFGESRVPADQSHGPARSSHQYSYPIEVLGEQKTHIWRHFQMYSTRAPVRWIVLPLIQYLNTSILHHFLQPAPTGSVVSSFCECLTEKTSYDAADAVKACSCHQNASFSCWGCICHQSRYPAHVVISLHWYYLY